ncbi:RICIN domain-containing protein [Neisseriaceae bacterium JH1-16]|nr:RICIN domain-containing protein [Neisseriaceae bacterium JH1-16]
MAFSSVPYFITYTQNTTLAITANDSITGAGLKLGPVKNNILALFNIDFDNGVFGLAASGNQLVIDVSQLSNAKGLILTEAGSTKTQRWDLHSRPGFILNSQNSGLVIDDEGRGGLGSQVWLYEFNASPAQQWTLQPLTSLQASAYK